jgi:antitoxin VapB
MNDVAALADPDFVTAKLFTSGRSQAVRLPKALRFEGTEVIARRFGNGVLLLPVQAPWTLMQQALQEFEPGFEMQREQPVQPAREALLP